MGPRGRHQGKFLLFLPASAAAHAVFLSRRSGTTPAHTSYPAEIAKMSKLGMPSVSLQRQPSTGALVGLTDGSGGSVMAKQITCQRVYEETSPQDGKLTLVDRIWPRACQRRTPPGTQAQP
ncbi:DUF488 family protein, N3 subclade [Streptomyces sp. NPDC001020]